MLSSPAFLLLQGCLGDGEQIDPLGPAQKVSEVFWKEEPGRREGEGRNEQEYINLFSPSSFVKKLWLFLCKC